MNKLLVVVGLVGSVAALGQGSKTRASSVEPRVAKPGMTLTIKGVALDRSQVEQVFLTDHRFDLQMKVLEQTEGSLTIRVPKFAKPGRQQLLVLTAGENGVYLEMPLYVVIEAEDEVLTAKGDSAAKSAGGK